MLKPSFSEVKKIAQEGGYRAVPLCVELLRTVENACGGHEDFKERITTVICWKAFRKKAWGQYTFLGFDPKLEITCTGGNEGWTA